MLSRLLAQQAIARPPPPFWRRLPLAAFLLCYLGHCLPAGAQTVFTRTPIGSLTQSPSSSYSGSPSNIKDGSTTTTWVSNFTNSNIFKFAFDPNLDGQYTTADLFRIDQLRAFVPVGSSWALKSFKAETLAYGDTVWKPLFSATTTYPSYNYAAAAAGGALTATPGSSYSGTPGNVIDGTINSSWVSNFAMSNVFELAFDPNLSGTTGLAGDTADRFTLDRVVINNGNSSWSLKDFRLDVKRNGGTTWQPVYASSGSNANFNFAASARGGVLIAAPASSYSGAPAMIIDSTTNTAWVSNFSMSNAFTLNFDPNLNGTTGAAGDVADRFTLANLTINNGNSSWSLKDFLLDVKRNGSSTWQPLYSANATIAGHNYASSANGGKLLSSPATAYSGVPGNLIDATTNTAWVSNFTMSNVFEVAFDPNLNGITGVAGDAADRFTVDTLALNNGNSSWSLKDFRIDVKRNGGSTWLPLYSSNSANSAYNYAASASGGILTSAPASAYSGTPTNILDSSTNTAWVSNFSMNNVFELAFDANLNGTTGAGGDVADRFTLDTLLINNGNSSWSLKDFRLDVRRNGASNWQPLYASTGTNSNYNFAATAKGGTLTASPASAYSGTPANLIDSTTNTAWVSNFSMSNVFEFAFDPNLNGQTGLAGDSADQFSLTSLTINNGNSSWSLKDFRVDVKRAGSASWVPLYSSNASYAAYNFAATAAGGALVAAPASAYSGVPGNIIDSSTNTAWVSNFTMSNLFEFAFDPTLSGSGGTQISTLTEVSLNNGGTSWALKDFQIWVKVGASWSLAGTFTAAQTGATQTFVLTPVSNVSAVRLQTLSNYGGSVLQINEFEIHGSYTGGNPVFSAAQSSNTQTFDLTLANSSSLNDVTAVRLTTLNNFGGSVLQINEVELRGSYAGNNPIFTASQSAATQSFDLSGANAGNLSGIDALRITTLNNYGGSVLQINELEARGNFTGSSPIFRAAQSAATQTFDLTAANSGNLTSIDAVRLTTLNNYGGSVLQINEFEVRGTHTGPIPIFTAAQSGATQVFDLTAVNSDRLDGIDALRLTTLNNYGGSVLQLNELEARGSYSGNNPVFTAAQSAASQNFDLAAANAGNLSGIDAIRLTTLNNYGGSVLQINEFEARGVFTGNNPVFTVDNTLATNTYDLAIAANSDRRSNIVGLRMSTIDNYGGSVLQINEFEGIGQLTGLTAPADPNQPSAFNCMESSTATGSADKGSLYTKVVGNAFTVDIAALKSDGSIQTTFAGTTVAELIDVSGQTWPLSANACATAPGVTPSVAQNMTFTGADQGRKAVSFNVASAHPSLACRVTNTTNGINAQSCSYDRFVVRPAAITLSSTANAAAPDARALPVVKAGASFSVGIGSSPSYSGTLTLNPGVLTAQGGAIVGALAPSTFSASAATFSATYTEVGYVYLPAGAYRDSNYTVLDQNGDCVAGSVTDTPDGSGKVGCDVGNAAVAFGRFIPDHFDTTVTQGMLCPANQSCVPAFNGFVYSGQPFTTTVTARNAAGAITQNYTGTFAPTTALSAWNKPASTGAGLANPPAASGILTSTPPLFVAGLANISDATYTLPNRYDYLHPTAANWTAPTDMYVRAIDLDAVSSDHGSSSTEGGITVLSGRLHTINAHGSERWQLAMDVNVEYWNGTRWAISWFDTLLPFGTSNIVPINCLLALRSSGAAPNNCIPGILAQRVASNGNGKARIWMSAPGITTVGSADIFINGPVWLPSTVGRATFGLYKDIIIYRREVY